MAMQSTLFLHHEVMLLALHQTNGTVLRGIKYQYAIAGAVLAELLLNKRITLDQSGKKQTVDPVSEEPLGEPLREGSERHSFRWRPSYRREYDLIFLVQKNRFLH